MSDMTTLVTRQKWQMKNWEKFRQTRTYDLIAGLPLILWYGYGLMKLVPNLATDAGAMLMQPNRLIYDLRFFTIFASAIFNFLLVYLVVVRHTPVKRTPGIGPRFCGVAGTFLGVAMIALRPVHLSLLWQSLAAILVFSGTVGSVLVLTRLGRSFSIMPEARLLVTSGPYAYARHPLYVMELISFLGNAIQFAQPWAGLLAVGMLTFQVLRTFFEERILAEAYPEYARYQARVKRFGII